MKVFLNVALRAAQFIFLLALLYFAHRLILYHYNLVVFPYSNTLREGAMMTSTDALVKGLNPYSMSLEPRLMNQYGIIYPLIVWPWAKLFGTTIVLHRIVTALSILGSCLIVFLVLRKMSVSLLLSFWSVLMLYASLMFPGTSTPTIDPGATGMFFFLLTIFVPWFYKFSYPSLLLSILFGILAFYTKIYTFLGVFVIVSYLFLFISKKKSIIYGLFLVIFFVISINVVNRLLPAYFDNCFFAAINMGPAWSSMERLHEQVVIYKHLHLWTFILMGLFILGYGFKNFKIWEVFRGESLRAFFFRAWQSYLKEITLFLKNAFHNKKFSDPLIKLNFPIFIYAALCSSFVLYMSLGRHSGAMLWYFFQLLSPFVLIAAAWLFSSFLFWPIVCVPFLIYNLHVITDGHDYKWFNKGLIGWPQVTSIISQHQHILNSPLIAPILIEQNKEVFDNGQAEYFLPGGQRAKWMKGLFKEDDRVSVQMALFFQNIRSMVQNKEFDLIILQPSLLPLGVADDIRKYYKFEGQVFLLAPQDRRPYAVTVWRPL